MVGLQGRPRKLTPAGKRFGTLEVLYLDHVDRHYGSYYAVRCTNCGHRKVMRGSDLRAGKGCGRCNFPTWY